MVIKEAVFELDPKKQGRNTLVSAEAGSSASGKRPGQGHNLFGLAETVKQGSGGWHCELSQERALCPERGTLEAAQQPLHTVKPGRSAYGTAVGWRWDESGLQERLESRTGGELEKPGLLLP